MGNKQTEATKRWNAKVGYISKSYKLKKDMVEAFADACRANGESQMSVITRLMKAYIEDVAKI